MIVNIGLIDTAIAPVHILCGEYDLTCTPEDATRTDMVIAGSTLEIMTELGHFPMSENPKRFRPYFARALALLGASRA